MNVMGDPVRLQVVPEEVRPALVNLEGAVADYRQALAGFEGEANELGGPHLDDVSGRVLDECEAIEVELRRVEGFATALSDLDAQQVGGPVVVPPVMLPGLYRQVGRATREPYCGRFEQAGSVGYAGWQAVHAVNGRAGLLSNLGRMGNHGGRAIDAGFRMNAAERSRVRDLPRYHPGTSAQAYNARVADHHRYLDGRVADARADRARHLRDLRRLDNPVTRAGRRLADSRAGQMLGTASRRIGWAGAFWGVGEAAHAFSQGETEKGTIRTLQTAGGIAMLVPFPPAAAVGTVVVAGATIYEYREEIAHGLGVAGNKVKDGVNSAGRAVADTASAAGSTAQDMARDAGERLKDLNPFT